MHRKALLFSLITAAGVVLLVAISAVTVYALAGTFDTASIEEAVEVIPVQAEPVSQSELVEPVLRYEHANYDGKAGCRYSAKLQMTEAPSNQVADEPLAQAQP